MKKLFYFSFIIFLSIACSNKKNENAEPLEDQITEETTFVYNYDPNSTELKWTAFKHMDKVPVGGKFDSVIVDGFVPSVNLTDALKNLSFNIFTSSTNTQDKDRDLKIIANFFGNMLNSSVITGKIKEIEGIESGKGKVLIDMNGSEKLIPFEWKISENNQFILNTKLNVLDWSLEKALSVLNTVCLEKHTSNGANKLWPDVEVVVFTTLLKEHSS